MLPSTTDFSDINESALDNPLPWDSVPAADYEQASRVKVHLDHLRARSAQRTASDPAFIHQLNDVARLREDLAKKAVSLNEAERRKELEKAKAQQSERKRQQAKHHDEQPIRYEVTVGNAASPGLPKPLASSEPQRAPGHAQAASQSPGNPGSEAADDAPGGDSRSDLVLDETVRILTDYVQAERTPPLPSGGAPSASGPTSGAARPLL